MKTFVYLTQYTILLLLVGCGTFPRSTREGSLPPNHQEKIQALMDAAQKHGDLPAIAALISWRGTTHFFHSQGRRAIQFEAPVEGSDRWHLGSDTKAMTALLVALAAQEGKLSYDSKVSSLLKSQLIHPLNQNLTIRQLLSHTSGLKDVQEVKGGNLWKALFKSTQPLTVQRREMSLASLQAEPHLTKGTSQPVSTFQYANINYVIAGAVLEQLYNTPWEQVLAEKIFTRLTMTSCGFGVAGLESETTPSQPWPHIMDKGKLIGIPPKAKADNPPMLGPAGTAHCSLQDWHKFVLELTRIWKRTGSLITDSRVTREYFGDPHSSYTAGGWGRNDEKYKTPLFQHSGSNTLNFATAEFAPDRELVILIATNRGDATAETAMRELMKSLNGLLF